jgi:hypothetical protein
MVALLFLCRAVAVSSQVRAETKIKAYTHVEECLDLQYARATANNPVGLYSCGGLGGIGAKDTGINWPPLNATL